jgi:hypothetical protein
LLQPSTFSTAPSAWHQTLNKTNNTKLNINIFNSMNLNFKNKQQPKSNKKLSVRQKASKASKRRQNKKQKTEM